MHSRGHTVFECSISSNIRTEQNYLRSKIRDGTGPISSFNNEPMPGLKNKIKSGKCTGCQIV